MNACKNNASIGSVRTIRLFFTWCLTFLGHKGQCLFVWECWSVCVCVCVALLSVSLCVCVSLSVCVSQSVSVCVFVWVNRNIFFLQHTHKLQDEIDQKNTETWTVKICEESNRKAENRIQWTVLLFLYFFVRALWDFMRRFSTDAN